MKVGALGTHSSLGLAPAKNAKYLLASTSECYGDPAVYPQTESYWGHVNPTGPRGVVRTFHKSHGGKEWARFFGCLRVEGAHVCNIAGLNSFSSYGLALFPPSSNLDLSVEVVF